MKSFLALIALLCLACTASARQRSIHSCDEAPLLADLQRQLPDYILATSADVQPKLISKMPQFALSLYKRSSASLICVVVALDSSGKTQGVMISYPAGLTLTSRERDELLPLQWSPAQLNGQPRPSLVSIKVSAR